MTRTQRAAAALILLAAGAPSIAAETITYRYDARGRLVRVERTGPVNQSTSYGHDKANNRVSKAVQESGVAAGSVANASFEAPDLGSGYAYAPQVPGLLFEGGTGLAGNGSAWNFAPAPSGDQVAFAQGAGASMHQNVSGLVAGATYVISFSSARRPWYGVNPIVVRFNGVTLGTFTPPDTSFTRFTTPAFQASGTTGTIEFKGDGVSPGDISSAIDMVAVTPASP